MSGTMVTSNLGRQFIIAFEKVRTAAYLDAVGVPTIGIGRIKGVKMGDTCTVEQAHAWFAEELKTYESAVNNTVKVPINQFQFDALVSFAYNCGTQALRASSLLMRLNENNPQAAARGFELWNKGMVNGVLVPLAGLTIRRRGERRMFETGFYEMHDGPVINGNDAMPDFSDVQSGVAR